MKEFKNVIWLISLLVACTSPKSDSSDLLIANIPNHLNDPTVLDIDSEIENVSYIPLAMTYDDASFIGRVLIPEELDINEESNPVIVLY